MEHSPKKISTKEATMSAEDRNKKDSKIHVKCIEPEANSEQPGTSTITSLNTGRGSSSNQYETLSADPMSTLTSHYNLNHPWLSTRKLAVRNYEYSNTYTVGCSSTKEEINRQGRCSYKLGDSRSRDSDLMYEDKCFSKRTSRSLQEEEHNSSIRDNVELCRISTHETGGPSNARYNRSVSNNQLQSPHSSSFIKFFLGQAMEKCVPCSNPESFATSTDRYENEQAQMSDVATDALMNRYSLHSQIHSENTVQEGPELSHSEINLREWLVSKCSNVSKSEKLCLFKQIVQTVDNANCQGVTLLELRPSSFILLNTGNVKYIGSLQEIELLSLSQGNKKKRSLEPEISGYDRAIRPQAPSISKFIDDKGRFTAVCEGASTETCWLTSENFQLEKKWYASPEGLNTADLLSFNTYALGLLLFEFLCHFESTEAHSAAMLDLHCRILPPSFLSECPKEAGFCFWLLHPDPSSRPTIREILQSELLNGYKIISPSDGEASSPHMVVDSEVDLLVHFLVSLKEHMQNKASNLYKSMAFLDEDIKEVEQRYVCKRSRDSIYSSYTSQREPNLNECTSMLRDKLLGNISQLENAYFCAKSPVQLKQMPDVDRSDKDVLSNRDNWSLVQTQHNLAGTKEKSLDRVGTFFDGICRFARYTRFKVCGTLRNGDILNANNVICSLSFDREEQYIAAAGVSKKIKIFELSTLLNDYIDVQYPVLEMSNKSKFSCICWNNYIKNYLASTDYDGLVQIWDTSTGHAFAKYKEHQRRAWSVDFSLVDPTKFASGGDDCSVRIWSANERNSIGVIENPANICCVQFSAFSSHLLAFGSADYRVYCYDLRHTKIPWCTLTGHGKAVSYVRHLDSDTLVSASTDNTLKVWDLKNTCLDGLSPNACCLTMSGHTNEKNFVGLAVSDGYIACGSETNEVYAYYRCFPMPITSHKFQRVESTGHDGCNGQFVSSVCWRKKSTMIAAANSTGSINILRLV